MHATDTLLVHIKSVKTAKKYFLLDISENKLGFEVMIFEFLDLYNIRLLHLDIDIERHNKNMRYTRSLIGVLSSVWGLVGCSGSVPMFRMCKITFLVKGLVDVYDNK